MILNTIRMLADWYADPANGINARLGTVPKDAGDPTPPPITVIDSTRNDALARQHLPEDFPTPSIIVFHPQPADLNGWIGTGMERGDVTIVTGYVTDAVDSAAALVRAYLTLRASKQAMNALFQGNEAARARNGISIVRVISEQLSETMAEVGHQLVQIVRVTTFNVEDGTP